MRVAAIHYLNTLPLIHGLRNNADHELILDTPSSCFKRLIDKEVDVALIPVFGTQIHPDVRAISGIGIAAEKQTESVLLYSHKPLDKIQTVSVDPASLTSVNLLKVILQKKYQNEPQFITASEGDLSVTLKNYDAALVIGDGAIVSKVPGCNRWDLATEWYDFTNLPFIFAVWGSIQSLNTSEQNIFRESLVEGLGAIDKIIEDAQKIISVDSQFLKRYYNLDLHYQLTPNDYQGLSKYLALAADLKLVKNIRTDIWM
jgi:predicted solute-binding protein